MATGGDLSRTFEGGHQSYYDFPCSLCEEQGKHVEAISYCEECFVYMCDTCVTTIHNRIPLNTRHKLLDQEQFPALCQSALKSFPTKRCLKHSGELMNIFCGNHDVVCCSVCKVLDHSNCAETQHLPDAAKGIQGSKEFQIIKEETKVFLSDVLKALADRTGDISRIAKEKQEVKQAIDDFRKKVNKYFDDLEEQSLHELDLKERSITRTMEQDRKFLDKTQREAEDILKQLDSFKGDNECELFFHVKTGKRFVHESIKRVCEISSAARESIVLKLNANIDNYISALDTIGSIDINVASVRHSPVPSTANIRSPHSCASTSSQVLSGNSDTFAIYETQYSWTIDVKERSDRNDCEIFDICQSPAGDILITDFSNTKIKLLDQSYKLTDSLQLLEPAHICVVGSDEAAVSVCTEKKFEFVSVGKKLSFIKTVNTGSYCRGMVYADNKLYVCCGNHLNPSSGFIEVYNNAGQLQYSLPRASQRLSAVPKRITVSDDGHYLIVTSFDTDNISILDLTGNEISTFSHDKLKFPTGICTDGTGSAFVCGFESNTVVQFSPKHRKIEVILTEADGVLKPRKAYYDRRMSRLLVACGESNKLLTFSCKLN